MSLGKMHVVALSFADRVDNLEGDNKNSAEKCDP
jgi:hypothetical protein